MKKEDIYKEKLDRKEHLDDTERQHYKFPKGKRPKPRIGYSSKDEISNMCIFLKLPLTRFHDIRECPVCGKLHLYKKKRVEN